MSDFIEEMGRIWHQQALDGFTSERKRLHGEAGTYTPLEVRHGGAHPDYGSKVVQLNLEWAASAKSMTPSLAGAALARKAVSLGLSHYVRLPQPFGLLFASVGVPLRLVIMRVEGAIHIRVDLVAAPSAQPLVADGGVSVGPQSNPLRSE